MLMMITFCSSYMQVLRKRPTGTKFDVHRGLSDIAFSSNDNSRLVKVVIVLWNFDCVLLDHQLFLKKYFNSLPSDQSSAKLNLQKFINKVVTVIYKHIIHLARIVPLFQRSIIVVPTVDIVGYSLAMLVTFIVRFVTYYLIRILNLCVCI